MNDVILNFNHGATLENGYLAFSDGLHTAIEPIYLDVELEEDEFDLELSSDEALDLDMDMAVIVSTIAGDHYQGAYIVTPLVDEQTKLLTKNKVMDDDVTVLEIPYAEVSNLIGGKTAIIGGI